MSSRRTSAQSIVCDWRFFEAFERLGVNAAEEAA
jgi:hypothetical protein